MAFADPQSIKIGETEHSLPRVSTGDYRSVYSNADGTVELKISTDENRRKRQVYRIDHNKITDDPFDDTQNVEVSMSCYVVVDRPLAGYTNEEALEVLKGLVTALSASSYASAVKLLGSES